MPSPLAPAAIEATEPVLPAPKETSRRRLSREIARASLKESVRLGSFVRRGFAADTRIGDQTETRLSERERNVCESNGVAGTGASLSAG